MAAKTKASAAPAPAAAKGFYSPETASDPKVPAAKAAAPKAKKPKTKASAAPAPGPRSALPHLETVRVDTQDEHMTADAGLTTRPDDRGDLQADIARIRAQRKPFGAFTQKLAYPARPGYHRHWFSDEPGRVDEAVSNGWAHVGDKDSKPVKRVVGRGREGGAMYGFLMELPKVFWDEDMQAKHDAAQARIDEIKKSPFRAKPGQAQKSDQDKFYSAREEPVQMTQSVVRSSPST
jgi:hypothetical protein